MNDKRRQEIRRATELIDQAKSMLESIMECGQESYDNLPESFQFGEKGEKSQNAIDNLQSSIDFLVDSIDYLGEAAQ